MAGCSKPFTKKELLSDEKWKEHGKCPLSFYDGDYFRYCAVEGKLYGKSPFKDDDINNTNCDGDVLNCPRYNKDTLMLLLKEKREFLKDKFDNKLDDLENMISRLRQKKLAHEAAIDLLTI